MGLNNKTKAEKQRDDMFMQMAALRMQERQESREEIAKYIYEYKGRTMSAGASLLCPGDFMLLSGDDHLLMSARGTAITMDVDSLQKMVDAGVLDCALDAEDLSSPDFGSKLDAILDKMVAQSEYRDAYAYCPIHNRDVGVAAFAEDPLTKTPTGIIIRSGSEFAAAAGKSIGDDVCDIVKHACAPGARQCSYDEFNPHGTDIKDALDNSMNGEYENKTEKYEQLREQVVSEGDLKSNTKDVKQEKTEKAKAGSSLRDKLNEELEAQEKKASEALEAQEIDVTPLSTSRAMRFVN